MTTQNRRSAGVFWAVCFIASVWAGGVGFCPSAQAEIRLPKVFASHMVLQRQKPIVIWGWAEPNETVTVKLASESRQVQADDHGDWKAVLPAMNAGGPYHLTVSGSSTVRYDDVMIGEVWLCSGQSNMEFGIGRCRNAKAEIAAANYPDIRLLMVPNHWTPTPQDDMNGVWKVCSPKTVAEGGWEGFSAVAYFFGRELHQKLGVAIGLIDADWGGTRIQPWTPPVGYASVPALKHEYKLVQLADPRTALHQERLQQTLDQTARWLGLARKALTQRTLVPPMPTYPADLLPPHNVQDPTALFNGMIHPLIPFAIRGAIWYQGESNNGDGMIYADRMRALINGWRDLWGEGDFPFYYVQIAPYNYGGNPATTAELWEAQTAAQAVPNTGMVVINDIGNLHNIHPTDKQDVGHRLALWALAKTYGESNLVYCGPTFRALHIEGDTLRVSFNHVGGGLVSRDDKPLNWFEIIDAHKGGWVPAQARIDGSSVVLSAPSVKHPVAMRFAWSMLAEPNLMNTEGLPAGAFRAGKVPKRDLLVMQVPEAKDYQLVYDLNLNKLGPNIEYDVDNSRKIHQPFDRVAYFLELQGANGKTHYLYVSMDAFTDKLNQLGVPTFASGAHFQENVGHLDVYSNVRGIVTGTNLAGGSIEFWPNNYGPSNSAHVPHASSRVYDFGDEPAAPRDGYGCMQVNNHNARQTLFAVNDWKKGSQADIGIGNQHQGNPDWTFAANAGSYPVKRLRVLVRCRK